MIHHFGYLRIAPALVDILSAATTVPSGRYLCDTYPAIRCDGDQAELRQIFENVLNFVPVGVDIIEYDDPTGSHQRLQLMDLFDQV